MTTCFMKSALGIISLWCRNPCIKGVTAFFVIVKKFMNKAPTGCTIWQQYDRIILRLVEG